MRQSVLTPEYLAILYTAYKQLPPFDKLLLPPASEIKFLVVKSNKRYGRFDEGNMAIEISSASCSHFTTILAVLLHEMTHLTLFASKDPGWYRHGKSFLAIKHKYAAFYNLDPKAI
jgi:hypothetical protein